MIKTHFLMAAAKFIKLSGSPIISLITVLYANIHLGYEISLYYVYIMRHSFFPNRYKISKYWNYYFNFQVATLHSRKIYASALISQIKW